MSLKAYDGMMSRKNINYIQKEIVKRLDRFREESENKLAKKYASLIVNHIDGHWNIFKEIEFDSLNESALKQQIKNITVNDDTTIMSYIYQASTILSEGYFVNGFMAHLNISLEPIHDKKILIYPNIIVEEHREILLEFLEDWYCQNQCDPDSKVSKRQWNQREKDWYSFNEIDGLDMKIILFDPRSYQNSINRNFRGDNMFEKVLKYIPSDEKRIKKIAKNEVIKKYEKEANDKGEKLSVWDVVDKLTKEDNTEIQDYIDSNNIEITKIDLDFLKNAKLNDQKNL